MSGQEELEVFLLQSYVNFFFFYPGQEELEVFLLQSYVKFFFISTES